VHIGVGGSTRARRALQDALAPQDYLYLVVERGVGPDRARCWGAVDLLRPRGRPVRRRGRRRRAARL
jgi:hypothetical protein